MNASEIEVHNNHNANYSLDNIKVLIIDEDSISREILKNYLDTWQIKYDEALNAKKALQKLQSAVNEEDPFDLAYIDINITAIGGLMLSQYIEDNSDINGTKRIIVMPDFSDEISAEEKLKAGVSGFLSKPYRSSTLLEMTLQALERQQSLKPILQKIDSKIPHHQLQNARILIAEDNIVNQKVATSLLKNIVFKNIDIADNGELAFNMAQKTKYDLILMDCQMPTMSGYESTGIIRNTEKLSHLSRTLIIATTDNAMIGDREKCFASGMDDYLTKPIKADTLSECLIRWLSLPPLSTINNDTQAGYIDSIDKEASTQEILDMQTITSLEELMEEDFSSLLQSYLDDAPKLLADIKNSLIHADIDVLKRSAHTLKSSSYNIGGKKLGYISMKIETFARKGNLAKCSMMISDLDKTLTETIAAINGYKCKK